MFKLLRREEELPFNGALAISADSNLLALWHFRNVFVWELERGALIRRFDVKDRPGRSSLALCPDGMLLAANQGGIFRIWDIKTATLEQKLQDYRPLGVPLLHPCGSRLEFMSNWLKYSGQNIVHLPQVFEVDDCDAYAISGDMVAMPISGNLSLLSVAYNGTQSV